MKLVYVIVLMSHVLMLIAKPPNPNKYKNINIDVILRNPKIVNSYILCLLDRKPCTAEGRDLKGILNISLSYHWCSESLSYGPSLNFFLIELSFF